MLPTIPGLKTLRSNEKSIKSPSRNVSFSPAYSKILVNTGQNTITTPSLLSFYDKQVQIIEPDSPYPGKIGYLFMPLNQPANGGQ